MRSPKFFPFPGIKLPRDSDHAECSEVVWYILHGVTMITFHYWDLILPTISGLSVFFCQRSGLGVFFVAPEAFLTITAARLASVVPIT